jgi:subtilisin family serine protease
MCTRSYRFAVAAIVFAITIGFAFDLGPAAAQGRAAPIRLRAATFTPALGERPNIPARMARAGYAAGERGYYLVQFRGPVQQAWKDALAAQGADVLDYLPDNAFKVRMTPAVAARIQARGEVAWVGMFEPAFTFDPAAIRDGPAIYTVRIERGANAAGAVQQIAATRGLQLAIVAPNKVQVIADRAQIEAVARVPDVAWIEPYTVYQTHNEYGGGQIIGGVIANTRGYDGSTQITAVADTGLGGGTPTTAHRDIPSSRIVQINNWPGTADSCFQTIYDDGAIDVDSGHGTHVAGSVLSGGDPGGFGKGVAPAARLVFQATENYVVTSSFCKLLGYANGYYLTGLPADLNQLFQQAYDQGARIHANSWGSAAAGDYNANSAEADQFTWNKKDMTITFSAGNEGADANADGVVDNDSIGSPATAKNVITIGASENDRQGHYECDTSLTYTSRDSSYQNGQTCASMGGQNLLGTPRQRWGFTANPIADDPTAGNAEQMAAFSSRGPTDDGRIKPDVVAPGTWVLSAYSDNYQEGYDSSTNPRNGAYQSDGWGIPRNAYYKYFGGTSMSNPLAAGAAAVVRDFYNKAKGVNASSALVKATLINSAVDLLDENNDGANDNDYPIPNNHEGWGRINLDNATDGTAQFVDNAAGLNTGSSVSYSYTALGGAPLKITLVWTDYPSTESAAKNLVNDLNLVVTGPGGVEYRGNVFSGGWSVTGGSADTTNNVENVYLQSPAAGSTWTVQISGANVPNGPQPFALVVDGAQTAAPPPPPAAPTNLRAEAASSSQINLSWTDNANNEDSFKVERCQGSGCSNFAQIATVGANVTSYSDTGLAANTSYSYRVRASNAGGDSGFSNTASATTPAAAAPPAAPTNLTAVAPNNSTVNLSWTDNANNEDGFKVERCQGNGCSNFVQIATTGANVTSYQDTGRSPRTVYRYRVRAYNAAGNSAYSNTVQIRTPR